METRCQTPPVRRGPRCPSSGHPNSFINLLRVTQSRGQVPSGLSQGSPMSPRARQQHWSPVQPHLPPSKGQGLRGGGCARRSGAGAGHGAGELGPGQMSHSLE